MKSIYVDSQGNEWENGGTYTDASLVTLSNGTTVQADSNALHSKDTQIDGSISDLTNKITWNDSPQMQIGGSVTIPSNAKEFLFSVYANNSGKYPVETEYVYDQFYSDFPIYLHYRCSDSQYATISFNRSGNTVTSAFVENNLSYYPVFANIRYR